MDESKFAAAESIGDRYLVQSTLGRGGMGEVLHVFDRSLQKDLALKLIHDQLTDELIQSRFIAEFQITSRLNHPHIITVYDFGFTPKGRPFYTMELIEGETLEDSIWNMSLERFFGAVFEICLALDRIHRAGLIHNDIKDRNVMIDTSGKAIVMDLGLVATGTTRSREFKGTIGYAAPEIVRGESYDHRADLYSLGVMIYKCLTGKMPIEADSVMAVLRAQLQGKTAPIGEFRPDLDPVIREVITRLMAVDPLRRYPSAVDIICALAASPATGLSSRKSMLPPVFGLPEDFIGRERELAHLQAYLEPGTGISLVLPTGVKGIGKTRLARELKIQTQVKGIKFISVRIAPGGEAPLDPVRKILKTALAESGDVLPVELKDYVPQLSGLLPGKFKESLQADGSDRYLEAEVRREKFLSGLAQVAFLLLKDTPCIIFIDDFQWVDSGTVRWVEALLNLQRTHSNPLLILAACTEPEWRESRDPHIVRFKAGLSEENYLRIPSLTAEETDLFLEKRLGSGEAVAELSRRLFSETGGNPQFLEVIIRDLVRRKHITRKDFKWHIDLAGLSELPIALGIKNIIERHLETLQPDQIQLLEVLSIFPGAVELQFVELVSGLTTVEALETLGKMIASGLIMETRSAGKRRYRFTQLQTKSIIYNRIQPESRKEMHLKVAELMKSRAMGDHVTMAYHLERGGDMEGAVSHEFRAGTEAENVYAYESAVEFFLKVLDFLLREQSPPPKNKQRYILAAFSHLAKCYQEMGQAEKAEEIVKKHLTFVEKHGSLSDQIPVLQNSGFLYTDRGQLQKARKYYIRADELFKRIEQKTPFLSGLKAQLDLNLGRIEMFSGRLEKAVQRFTAAKELSEKLKAHYLTTLALTNLAICKTHLDQSSVKTWDKCIRLAEQNDFKDILILGKIEKSMHLQDRMDITGAMELQQQAVDSADSIGAIRLKVISRIYSIGTALIAGKMSRVKQYLNEIEPLINTGLLKNETGRIHFIRGYIASMNGEADRAVSAFQSALDFSVETGNKKDYAQFLPETINVLMDSGRLDEAEKLLVQFRQMIKWYKFHSLVYIAEYLGVKMSFLRDNTDSALFAAQELIEKIRKPKFAWLRFRVRILKARARIQKEGPGGFVLKLWSALIDDSDRNGLGYYSVRLRLLIIESILKSRAHIPQHTAEFIRTLLSEALDMVQTLELYHLQTLAYRYQARFGKRTGRPELVYLANKQLSRTGPVPEFDMTETIRTSTMGSIRDKREIPTEWREKLNSDAGGKLLLELLDILK